MTIQTNSEKFIQFLVSSGSQFLAPPVNNRSVWLEIP